MAVPKSDKWKKALDLTGQKYNELTVIKRIGTKRNHSYWECQCSCGNIVSVNSSDLRTGNTTSCGCMKRKKFTTYKHGYSHERLYGIYIAMKTRCRNNKYYKDVNVCDEWLTSYIPFRTWALSHGYHDTLTIDRINPFGNYEPDNCRWVTMKEQAINKRKDWEEYGK